MAGITHSIHQQQLQIAFHGEATPQTLSVQLSRWVNEMLLPAMEAVLDELDLPQLRTRIETLTIDVGEIEGEDWERSLTDKICRLLRQQINEAPAVRTLVVVDVHPQRTLTLYSIAEKQSLVLTYLQTGQLPWYAAVDVSELMEWITHLVDDRFFSSGEGGNVLVNYPAAFHRFLRLAKPALLEVWANQWMTDTQQQWLPGVLRIALKLFGGTHAALEWCYAVLFDSLSAAGSPLWESLVPAGGEERKTLISGTKQLIRKEISLQQWQEKLATLDLSLQKKEAGQQQQDEGDPSAAESYFLNNAGLVLLHPFLKSFFTNLRLLSQNGDWRDAPSHRRGVLFCHYLCTGKTEAAEYELPLCKLLTGYPFQQPVETSLELTKEEADEAAALLQNIIEQWTILKSTSPQGLQNSFLSREGKLSRQDNGWRLQVQQKSYDLLLDHLPWGIGVIKTPWMKEMLFTEWT